MVIENGSTFRLTKTTYDVLGNKAAETDVYGKVTTYTYDYQNRVIKTEDALGNIEENIYEGENLVQTISKEGLVTKYRYDTFNREIETILPNGTRETKEYDTLGNIIQLVDGKGTVTAYQYDSYGREIEITITYSDGLVSTTSKTYDNYGNIIEQVVNGQKIIIEYDIYQREVSVTNALGYTTRKEYDLEDRVIKEIDALGSTATTLYNANGDVVESTDKNGNKSKTEYNTHGIKVAEIDALGNTTTYTYNDKGQVLETLDPYQHVTTYVYDAYGQTIEVKVDGITTQTIIFDAYGREIESIAMDSHTSTKYDVLGRMVKTTNELTGLAIAYTYDTYGNVTKEEDSEGLVTEKEYDRYQRLIKTTDAAGRKEEKVYDSRDQILQTTNYDGTVVKNAYDVNGNLLTSTDALGLETLYTYDALGNVLSEGDITYTYDSQNNRLSAVNNDGKISYTYNAFNLMTKVKDSKGNVVSYQYDDRNQLTEKKYAGKTVQYRYNDNGMLTNVYQGDEEIANYQYNHRNEPTKTVQKQVVTEKHYDIQGKVISQKSMKNQEVLYDVKYSYDGNQNIIKEVMNGKEHTYVYNEYDELVESHKYIGNTYVHTTYAYDAFGNQTVSNNQEGTKKYSYNDKNQVITIQTDKGTIDLDYDSNGNLKTKVDEKGHKETYTYNEYNKLTEVDKGQYVYTYAYDASQERISSTRTDTKDYHYDVWYDYVVDTEVVSEKESREIFNNVSKQITKKEANGDKCESKLSGKYDVVYYKEPEVTEYLLDRNVENSVVLATNDEVSVYGTTLLQVDNEVQVTGLNQSIVASVEGKETQRYYYDDYGNSKEVKDRYGYNGEVKDETGLIYLRARYYNPEVGRFIQFDNNYKGEQEEVVTQNRYTYTLNNPYKYVDRNGEYPITGSPGVSDRALDLRIITDKCKTEADVKKSLKSMGVSPTSSQGKKAIERWKKTNKPKNSGNSNSKNTLGVVVAGAVAVAIARSSSSGVSVAAQTGLKTLKTIQLVKRQLSKGITECPEALTAEKLYEKIYIIVRDVPTIKLGQILPKLTYKERILTTQKDITNYISVMIQVWQKASTGKITSTTVDGFIYNLFKSMLSSLALTCARNYGKQLVTYIQSEQGNYKKVKIYLGQNGEHTYYYLAKGTDAYDIYTDPMIETAWEWHENIKVFMELYAIGVLVYGVYKSYKQAAVSQSSGIDWSKQTDKLSNHSDTTGRVGSMPTTSNPNSSMDIYSESGELLQRRFFDGSGKVIKDIDFSHGGLPDSHTFPHDHYWDWSEGYPKRSK